MKNNRMTLWGRVVIALSSLALFAVLLFPMWQIQLSAPQYPEGLVLLIFPHKLGGNIDIINGLNHYIGMKTLHTSDFFEFTILPYIIGFFGVALLITGIIGRRRLLNAIFILFIFFGVVAMVDFWKWEYNYGHNLNPDAAIIVPGMAYQPPLIGFKQLLNFGAYSIPDVGGWIFVGAGIVMLIVVAAEWNVHRKKKHSFKSMASSLVLFVFVFVGSCNAKPEPIIIGKDDCAYCKMKISDNRFGAEFITKKGKTYKFDDIHCIVSFLQEKNFDGAEVKEIFLTDFSNGHDLVKATDAMLLKSDALRAPMGGNIASFSNADSLQFVSTEYKGSVLHWTEVYKP